MIVIVYTSDVNDAELFDAEPRLFFYWRVDVESHVTFIFGKSQSSQAEPSRVASTNVAL